MTPAEVIEYGVAFMVAGVCGFVVAVMLIGIIGFARFCLED